MTLIDDDGTYQLIMYEAGEPTPDRGYARYISDGTFQSVNRFAAHYSWNSDQLQVSATRFRDTRPYDKPVVILTALCVLPRRNEYGEVSP